MRPDDRRKPRWRLPVVLVTVDTLRAGGFGREELYDLESDPEERSNLAERDPRRAGELRARIRRWVEETPFTVLDPEALDEDMREHLRALGYL